LERNDLKNIIIFSFDDYNNISLSKHVGLIMPTLGEPKTRGIRSRDEETNEKAENNPET
jgi:hypothetical protein